MAVKQIVVFLFQRAHLLLRRLVLRLQAGNQLLQLHASELPLQILRQLWRNFLLLTQEVDNDRQHEVDQEDGPLNNVLFGLGKTFAWVPAGPFKEKVMDAAVQLTVQLTEVLAAVSLGNAVLLALVILVARGHIVLALAATELLQGRFPVVVTWSHQRHDLGV